MKTLASCLLLAFAIGCGQSQDTSGENGNSTQPDRDESHQHSGHNPHGQHEHGSGAIAHESRSGDDLIIQTTPARVRAGQPAVLKMMIHTTDGTMHSRFEKVHEAFVHLIVVREGLDTFDHLHPEVDASGNLKVTHTFPLGGKYRIIADYQPAGGAASSTIATLEVSGNAPSPEPLNPDTPGRVETRRFDVDISIEQSHEKNGAQVIRFQLYEKAGAYVKGLEPYLGAMGHLVIISAESGEYIHVHPAGTGDDGSGEVKFQAHIEKPGLYKGWGQFQHDGAVHVVPFVFRIP